MTSHPDGRKYPKSPELWIPPGWKPSPSAPSRDTPDCMEDLWVPPGWEPFLSDHSMMAAAASMSATGARRQPSESDGGCKAVAVTFAPVVEEKSEYLTFQEWSDRNLKHFLES